MLHDVLQLHEYMCMYVRCSVLLFVAICCCVLLCVAVCCCVLLCLVPTPHTYVCYIYTYAYVRVL